MCIYGEGVLGEKERKKKKGVWERGKERIYKIEWGVLTVLTEEKKGIYIKISLGG